MGRMKGKVRFQTLQGQPVTHGQTAVTPVARVFTIESPYFNTAWNWPSSLQVEEGDEKSTVPVINVTRMALIAIYGIGAAALIMMWKLGQSARQ